MNKIKLTIKDSSLSFLIGFLLCQLGVVVATCITLLVYKIFNQDTSSFFAFLSTGVGYLISAMGLYVVMVLVFLFFNKSKDNQIISKASFKKLIIYIGVALSSFIVLYPIITCVDSLLIKMGAKINTLSYELTTTNYFISLISLVIAPAICEELLFRGIIFKGLKPYGKAFSIILSALMFSLFHMSISQTIYPILMGLLFGVIMFYENNIYYCIAIHLTNNFLSLTLSYLKINLIFNHWSYIVLAIILFIGFVSAVLYFTLKNRKSTEKQPITKYEVLYLIGTFIIMIALWIVSNFS